MTIIFELNNKDEILMDNEKLRLKRKCFPIKVTLLNNKGKNESERIIFIREKNGKPKMMIS